MHNNNFIPAPDHQNDEFVPLPEAARIISMSKSFMKTLKYSGGIPYYQFGGRIRFRMADLKQFIDNCRVESIQKESADDTAR